MENERDIFSEGWSDEGVVSDEREAEELPKEDGAETAPVTEDLTQAAGAAEELDGEIRRFVRAFPDVRGEDIPGEVWEKVRGGEKLTEAFLWSERARLRRENERLRAAVDRRELNTSRSAGSQTGEGSGEVRMDAFEEGWEVK